MKSRKRNHDRPEAVVGAGRADMSYAFELAGRGRRVTVLEAHGFLGGRTGFWIENGMLAESDLHKFLGI